MGLLLFNWLGYKLVLNYMQQQTDLHLEARIDINDFDESELIEIRIALNIPYQTAWTEFERHYGEMELDGKHYTYVKRKIENGSLVLKCLPNPRKDIIKNTGNAFFKVTNNIDQENGKPHSPFAKAIKGFSPDFDNDKCNFQLDALRTPVKNYYIPVSSFTAGGFTSICEQPPDPSFHA